MLSICRGAREVRPTPNPAQWKQITRVSKSNGRKAEKIKGEALRVKARKAATDRASQDKAFRMEKSNAN